MDAKVRKDSVHYTIEGLDVERAQRPRHNIHRLFSSLFEEKSSDTSKSDFREDAKIWYLYLEEAEREAKERAELWRTGLDSLLIFAGLFAGIVSSFVIDARQDLQTNSDQRLLSDIRDALRERSIDPQITRIETTSKWINGLWIISLYITLFSAIMGVLAKAWLARFVPITTRREANYKDALRRYRLDKQAEDWHLEEVITLVPLLVQIASFLFFIGLVIQSFGDNQTLGHTLLAFCTSGALIYFVMTILPFWKKSSPFNTPLSDVFVWVKKLVVSAVTRHPSQSDAEKGDMSNDDNHALAEILFTKMIKSPNSSNVDEAIAEIASPSFKETWVEYLCRNGTPAILLARFQKYAITRTDTEARSIETMGNHLLALLHFVDYYEKKIIANDNKEDSDPKVQESLEALGLALSLSLQPGNPLHQWNNLPDPLRPLLFGLRTQITVLLPPSSQPHLSLYNADFSPKEVQDRPWEMALWEIQSSHRLHFALAACRGLIHGQRNLRTISASVLSLCLAKATVIITETGRPSEWEGLSNAEHGKAKTLAFKYLSALYTTIVSTWEDMAASTLSDASAIPVTIPEPHPPQTYTSVPRSLLLILSQSNHTLRIHAIKLLKIVSSLNPELFQGVIESSLETIADMIVYKDQDVRDDGLSLLVNVANYDSQIREAIAAALLKSVQSGMGVQGLQHRLRAIAFLKTMFGSSESLLYAWVPDAIPNLINLGVTGNPVEVRLPAMQLARELSEAGFAEVKQTVRRCLKAILDSEDFDTRYEILRAFLELLEDNQTEDSPPRPPFVLPWDTPVGFMRDMIDELLEKVVNLAIYSEESSIYSSAQDILRKINEDDKFDRQLRSDGIGWLSSVPPESNWRVRYYAVLVTEMFAKQLDVESTPLLQKLVELGARDGDDDVRRTSLRLILTLRKDRYLSEEATESIKLTIRSVLDLIPKEDYPSIRKNWIALLGDLAKNTAFSEAIPVMLQAVLKGVDSESREAAAELSIPDEFANDPKNFEFFASDIPSDLKVSLHELHEQWAYKLDQMKMLAVLSNHLPGLRVTVNRALAGVAKNMKDEIKVIIDGPENSPSEIGVILDSAEQSENEETLFMAESTLPKSFRRLLSFVDWDERRVWVGILTMLTEQFPDEFPTSPAIILQIAIHDPDSDVRSACVKQLTSLAKFSWVRALIEDGIVGNIDNFMDPNSSWEIRFNAIQILGVLDDLSDILLNKLKHAAMSDNDYDVRSEAVNALSVIAGKNEEKYRVWMEEMLSDNFESGMKDDHWKVRQAWIKFASPRIRDAEFFGMPKILGAAIEDNDYTVQTEAFGVLEGLVQNVKLRDSMASKLGKTIDLALRNRDFAGRAVSVLSMMTTPKVEGDSKGPEHVSEGHELWIQIIKLFSHTDDLQVLPKLIERALKEEPKEDTFRTLNHLFENVKLPDPITTMLPKSLDVTLKMSDTAPEVVLASIDIFRRLTKTNPEDTGHRGQPKSYENLLDKSNDGAIISRLAEISVKDGNSELREAALQVLKSTYENKRFRDSIKTSWSRIIENALKDQESNKIRENAIEIVNSLTEANISKDKFRPVVSQSIPQLLKIILTDEDEQLRKRIKDILYTNLPASTSETKLNKDALNAIPPMVTSITGRGKGVVLHLADNLQISDDTAASIALALTSAMLRNTSAFARATTVELLSRLYSRHRHSKPRLIESAIPEIITLALDEKDVGDARSTAIRLLVSLATPPESTSENIDQVPLAASVAASVLKQINPLVTRFMALLIVDSLRQPVVELLSVMSTEPSVRKKVVLQILSLALGPESPLLVCHVELLACLIMDGRFEDESTDYVILFCASTMATRPQLAPYRFEILTALWCRYRSKTIQKDSLKHLQKDLVTWFTFALFGRHARVHEVSTWRMRCELPETNGMAVENEKPSS